MVGDFDNCSYNECQYDESNVATPYINYYNQSFNNYDSFNNNNNDNFDNYNNNCYDGYANYRQINKTTTISASTTPTTYNNGPTTIANNNAFPCQLLPNWDYQQCYSYYANGCYNTCQFVNVIDMEDFMNNEKRKEKSRDAARCRRSKETEIFSDLAGALPLQQDQVNQLDKASIMRLAISYLRVRDMIQMVPDVVNHEEEPNNRSSDESIFLKSLEGFVLVLSNDGDFIYLSENVSEYLGISQIDLMGQNIYEYSHPCDHDEIKDILSVKKDDQDHKDAVKSFFIRLKCTLTSKGRSVNLKSAIYKVIHCVGHNLYSEGNDEEQEVRRRNEFDSDDEISRSSSGTITDDSNSNHGTVKRNKNSSSTIDGGCTTRRCLVAIGQPIPHPSNIEAVLPNQTFLTKHSLDMKFTYADEKMMEFLNYDSDDLIGKSIYDYHHAMDAESIHSSYKCLFSKGQCETTPYRFLVKTGGYVWVVTQATLIYDKMQKPQSVVSVNYLISGIECKDEIYSNHQLLSAVATTTTKTTTVKSEINIVNTPPTTPVSSSTITTTSSTSCMPLTLTNDCNNNKRRATLNNNNNNQNNESAQHNKLLSKIGKKSPPRKLNKPPPQVAVATKFLHNNNAQALQQRNKQLLLNNNSDKIETQQLTEEQQTIEKQQTNAKQQAIEEEQAIEEQQTIVKQLKQQQFTQQLEQIEQQIDEEDLEEFELDKLKDIEVEDVDTKKTNLIEDLFIEVNKKEDDKETEEVGYIKNRPLTATSKIFAPRTEEMNKGFLTFSEKEPGCTLLKEEPDDLTHLAPVAGDVCVPLDEWPYFHEIFDDFLMPNTFCPLMTDVPVDPVLSYRNSCHSTPELLSPNHSKGSECSLPSLSSPSDSMDNDDQLVQLMSLQIDDDDYNYNEMSLPLLIAHDIMWSPTDNNTTTNNNNNRVNNNNNNGSTSSPNNNRFNNNGKTIDYDIVNNRVSNNAKLSNNNFYSINNSNNLRSKSSSLKRILIDNDSDGGGSDTIENDDGDGGGGDCCTDVVIDTNLNDFNKQINVKCMIKKRACDSTSNINDVRSTKRTRFEQHQQQQQQQQNKYGSELLQQLISINNRRSLIVNDDDKKRNRNVTTIKNSHHHRPLLIIDNNNVNKNNKELTLTQRGHHAILRNLLVSGVDIESGYICLPPKSTA